MLIVVFGLPGSGKSYFASHLAKRMGAVYFSSDELRKEALNNPDYTLREKEKVYELLFEKASKSFTERKTVILDATFHKAHRRKKITELAQERNTPLYWIEIFANKDIIHKRLDKKRESSDADYSVYQKIKDSFEPFTQPHLKLESTNDNLQEMLYGALRYVKNGK